MYMFGCDPHILARPARSWLELGNEPRDTVDRIEREIERSGIDLNEPLAAWD